MKDDQNERIPTDPPEDLNILAGVGGPCKPGVSGTRLIPWYTSGYQQRGKHKSKHNFYIAPAVSFGSADGYTGR